MTNASPAPTGTTPPASATPPKSPVPTMSIVPKHRPIGITILGILALIAAALAVIHTLQMLHLLPIRIGEMRFWTFDLLGAILWGILAFIYLWVFRMLWEVNPQGWMFVVLLSSLYIIMAFVSILAGSSWDAVAATIVINGIILIYALLPGTKKAFAV
ncbi:MAG: hypothetical protein MUO26_08015 [Methanotrichaceae archaeon]|nr:hypothetical protein [Methanotrichaceae archaeon]